MPEQEPVRIHAHWGHQRLGYVPTAATRFASLDRLRLPGSRDHNCARAKNESHWQPECAFRHAQSDRIQHHADDRARDHHPGQLSRDSVPARQDQSCSRGDNEAKQQEHQCLHNSCDAHARWEPSGERATHCEVSPWHTRRKGKLECHDNQDECAEHDGRREGAARARAQRRVLFVERSHRGEPTPYTTNIASSQPTRS